MSDERMVGRASFRLDQGTQDQLDDLVESYGLSKRINQSDAVRIAIDYLWRATFGTAEKKRKRRKG